MAVIISVSTWERLTDVSTTSWAEKAGPLVRDKMEDWEYWDDEWQYDETFLPIYFVTIDSTYLFFYDVHFYYGHLDSTFFFLMYIFTT